MKKNMKMLRTRKFFVVQTDPCAETQTGGQNSILKMRKKRNFAKPFSKKVKDFLFDKFFVRKHSLSTPCLISPLSKVVPQFFIKEFPQTHP